MKKVIFGAFAVAVLASCSKGGPETVATEYLNALKNKDWEKAIALGNEDTKAKVESIKSFGGESGVTEVKDVKCTEVEGGAECTFCCMKDNASSTLKLKKEGDKWVVNDPKETPTTGEEIVEGLEAGVDSLANQLDAVASEVEATTSNE